MTSRLNIHCGPCGYEDITKNAKKWCTNCEEGFCGECEKSHKSMKVTRVHKIISIEDYRQIEDITVNMNCQIHDKKLDLYCKKHDIAVCVLCIPFAHKMCSTSDIISIDEASKDAKQSSALSDLEETISKTLDEVKHCINDRKNAMINVDKDEQTIRKTIADTRMNLNKYLDDLERKLILDLLFKHRNCKSQYLKLFNELHQKEKEIENMRQRTLKMKCFASDIQVFLGTRELNKTITEGIVSLKQKLRHHKNNKMELELHHVISSLMKEVRQFGEIKVTESKTRLQFKDAKIDQAQIQIHGSMQNVSNINLQLNQSFDIKGSGEPITGCVILSNGRIIISYYCGSGKLIEYSDSGKHIRDIPVSDKPFDITVVDTDRIAVTYPSSEYLEIINTRYNSVRKRVPCSIDCYGISYQDQKLYVVVDPQGILVMDLNGETLSTIEIKVSTVYSITTTRDRIYYVNQDNDAVHCCSMTGQEIWVFKDPSIYTPRGITVDNNQNVFVAGLMSNCLTVIQHDGTNSKILLTSHNELRYPKAVYYNKERKLICLGYKTGSIAVYQVA